MYDSHIELARLFARCTVTKKGCWEWTGGHFSDGYARIHQRRGHRVAWETANGPIPPGLYVCHHCDNKPCVNPSHLFLGTQRDNLLDASKKGRIPHGDTHHARIHPEKLARGNRHGSRTHPERILSGEKHKSAKLTEAEVKQIRALHSTGATCKSIAVRFNISETQTQRIVNRKRWKGIEP